MDTTRSPCAAPSHGDDVRPLLWAAETAVLSAVAEMTAAPGPSSFDNWPNGICSGPPGCRPERARELAALRFDDLDGRALRIERSVSAEELTTPKSGRGRCVTLGAATALLWARLEAKWRDREAPQVLGPWLRACPFART